MARLSLVERWRLLGGADRGPPDDVGFTRELLEQLASVFPVSDWFATGISNGGMLCYSLAHALPGRFSAIAPVAAVDPTDTPLPPQTIGVFHIHGVNDGLVPPGTPRFA